jgi:hypothetical protein
VKSAINLRESGTELGIKREEKVKDIKSGIGVNGHITDFHSAAIGSIPISRTI